MWIPVGAKLKWPSPLYDLCNLYSCRGVAWPGVPTSSKASSTADHWPDKFSIFPLRTGLGDHRSPSAPSPSRRGGDPEPPSPASVYARRGRSRPTVCLRLARLLKKNISLSILTLRPFYRCGSGTGRSHVPKTERVQNSTLEAPVCVHCTYAWCSLTAAVGSDPRSSYAGRALAGRTPPQLWSSASPLSSGGGEGGRALARARTAATVKNG